MAPVDIGSTTSPTWTSPKGLPIFRITCNTGRVIQSTDPGRALEILGSSHAGVAEVAGLWDRVARLAESHEAWDNDAHALLMNLLGAVHGEEIEVPLFESAPPA